MKRIDDPLGIALAGVVFFEVLFAATPGGTRATEQTDSRPVDLNPEPIARALETGRAHDRCRKGAIDPSIARLHLDRKRPTQPTEKPRVDGEDLFVERGARTCS